MGGAIPILAQAIALAQPQYAVTDMGAVSPLAIGQGGMVAGNWASTAMAWDAEHGLTAIPGIEQQWARQAYPVNAAGQVVGFDFRHSGQFSVETSYIWSRDQGTRQLADVGFDQLGFPIGHEARAINDEGMVAGRYFHDDTMDGFVWTESEGWRALPRFKPDRSTQAIALNNAGQILGYSEPQDNHTPILWQPDGSIVELGHLLNQYQNFLEDINDLGAICGGSYGPLGDVAYLRDPDGTYHGIFNPIDSTWNISAFGLNNHNMVVGMMGIGQADRPFVWKSQ